MPPATTALLENETRWGAGDVDRQLGLNQARLLVTSLAEQEVRFVFDGDEQYVVLFYPFG